MQVNRPMSEITFDDRQARLTDQTYQTAEIVAQRQATLQSLQLKVGERVLDAGAGPGLLSQDMARVVENQGLVHGIDTSQAMLTVAQRRCAHYEQVNFSLGDVMSLQFEDACFDAVVCTQVLLYVEKVHRALSEMYRVLKPGGRMAIVETDWRGLVLGSSLPQVTEQLIECWVDTVPSPGLPSELEHLLLSAGFTHVQITPIPILLTRFQAQNYAVTMCNSLASNARETAQPGIETVDQWLADLERRHNEGRFFFCVNRFLFNAWKDPN